MEIQFEFRDGKRLCVLRLKGRFVTGKDAGYLRDKSEELKQSGCGAAVADFTGVPYLDSTGIGFVVSLYTSMKNSGGGFAIYNLNRRVREVLDITRLSEIIPICAGEAEALAAVNEVARSAEGA